MALREVNINKMDIENGPNVGAIKSRVAVQMTRGVLGEVGNKQNLPLRRQPSVTGKATMVDLKNVKAKVQTGLQKSNLSTGNSPDTTLKSKIHHKTTSTLNSDRPVATVIPLPKSRVNLLEDKKTKQETPKKISFSSKQLPPGVTVLDQENDPAVLSEYAPDIYKYLRELERKFPVHRGYLSGQMVTKRMRAVLVDWMVEVHQQFHLLQETLYLSTALVDRFLQDYRSIDRKHLQLVGIACMWLASKYEEMFCPEVGDFVYIADNSYTAREIMMMESKVLETIKFNLGRPLPIHFLRRFSKAAGSTPVCHTMAKYILELTLVEYEMCHLAPSLLAAAALFLALWLDEGEKPQVWTPMLQYYTEYPLKDILPTVKEMVNCLINAPNSKYQSTRTKFSSSKLFKISVNPKVQSIGLNKIARLRISP